jgi:hypothetical protein
LGDGNQQYDGMLLSIPEAKTVPDERAIFLLAAKVQLQKHPVRFGEKQLLEVD